MKPKIFIDGEHGTTGLQIIQRLEARSDIKLLSIAHEDRHDKQVRQSLLNEADIVILCLPDDASREAAQMVVGGDTRLIDASTAHRTDPDWVFGFKELDPHHASRIAAAKRVSNPGCYSTGAIALIRPLTLAGVLPKDALITINAVSGYTGGGKRLIARMEDAAHEHAITAPHHIYANGLMHKHLPEITHYGMLDTPPVFTPSVGHYPQGMLVQLPLHLSTIGVSREELHACLAKHYTACPGDDVRVVSLADGDAIDRLDAAELAGEDFMKLYVFGNGAQVNLVAQLDNLGKGASGACVQALDLMIAG
ncbi:MAG: N-acetyl-gamma-glutamyl-phosphate reductase [Ahrensia sp.]|nr:N-acetyl-gamma-glutamyl-phosphate reductase [Ahrensia sp.]